jgi:hypothetical protein
MRIGADVRRQTGYLLKSYCDKTGLSYGSLKKGYVSNRAAKQLREDGITITGYVEKPQKQKRSEK